MRANKSNQSLQSHRRTIREPWNRRSTRLVIKCFRNPGQSCCSFGAGATHANHLSQQVSNRERSRLQSFFAWRIHILSRKWPITIALWVGSVLIVAAATATVICQSGDIIDVAENYVRLITVTQALVALVDVINTVTLCRYLRISKTGFSRCVSREIRRNTLSNASRCSTNDAINHIFLWTIRECRVKCATANF